MLYSVVDDRSGVAYQEYQAVYGEDVHAALKFLFNAMSPKADAQFPFQGRPLALYTDSGPVTRSHVFQQVMGYLGIDVLTHVPAGKDGRRTTARAKGKVERPFRTVKELHDTLYHFHAPATEAEANAWLGNFLLRYNHMPHRAEPHTRIDDWLTNVPPTGLREMCSWERFCTFARAPERRKVGGDARVSIDGRRYEVDPNLAGESVILWFGLFDDALYAEHGAHRYGPYRPLDGPIPLHRYRRFKKTRVEERADRVAALAAQLGLPRAALTERPELVEAFAPLDAPRQGFVDPDPFHELAFPAALDAKLAIADYLGLPLGKLPSDQLEALNAFLATTLRKPEVFEHVRRPIQPHLQG